MSVERKKNILNQAIGNELYKYPKKRLHETHINLHEASLEFIFAEGNLILELDRKSYVIECKKIKLNNVVFNLDE
ncbi:hypothetical protein NT04LS_0496 [Listeria seeligeri FSL S4-171]|uniref:hypothetical protein n=1 Tax=Listeria seeligeri TaxID=1640 RepID=UPI0001EB7E06|nr:hypothetical protein [Listeria seeligeri]EFS04331.1 hypothetical protein NT04LS_0496 [Listeria seeligeri FSL S4-171]MBF2664007.1 hypothetical protein [Listeria seeligeri]